jgi:predicted phage tail protein
MRNDDVHVQRIADPRPRMRRIAAKGDGKSGGANSGGTTTPHQPVDSPDTLRSLATARILEVLSEGVVAGMHTAALGGPFWNSVFLDNTPIADASNNFQFNITQGDFRYGYPSQDWIPGYSQSEAEFSVGVDAVYATPIVRDLSDTNITSVRYTITIPALYTQEPNGDVDQSSVGYAFDISIDGGAWWNAVTERVFGKCMSPYQRSVRVTLPSPITDTCQIRIERLDFNNVTNNVNEWTWTSYTEIVDGQLAFDDTCIASMAVDAEQFPNVPQRAYWLDGIMVEIPTNYNGRTHGYDGDWDGSFYIQWTNNPAWILYALLTNERWGLGRDLDPNSIDKWSFYDAAVWNDQGVPDGFGGTEVIWTCNCVINTVQDAWQVLTAVASNMIGSLYFANGTVFLVQDRQAYAPTRLFSSSDVESGLFEYTGSDYRSMYNAVAVTWIDPSQQYTPAVELVQDPVLVAQQGYRDTQLTAFGCTSRGQAQRMGRWLIYTSQYETEAVSFTVGLDNCDLRPGEIIAIADPSRAGARMGGRLLDDEGADTITLDAPAPTDAGGIYQILVSVGDPAQAETVNVIGLTPIAWLAGNQVQVSGKTSQVVAGCQYIAHSGLVEPTWWRVATVTDAGGSKYTILATQFTQEKFDYIRDGTLVAPPSFSLFPTGALQGPTNVSDTEYIYLDGTGTPQFGVIVSWSSSTDARVAYYQLEMSGPNGDYRIFRQVVGVQQDVPLMRQGQWTATIRAFDNIGRRSSPITYTFLPTGLSAAPQAPAGLYIQPQGGNLSTLTWIPTGEIDVVFFWIMWSPRTDGTATWDNAATSIARVDRNTTQISTPTRAGTFMVKTIDSLGQQSVSWAEAILLPQQTETSVFFDESEDPTWAGDLGTNWHHNLNQIWLPPPAAPEPVDPSVFPGDRGLALNSTPTRTAVYEFANTFDLGASTLVTMTGYGEGFGQWLGVTMDKWQPLASAQPLAMGANYTMSSWIPLATAIPLALGSSRNWDAHVEASISLDGITYQPWFPLKSTVITMRAAKWRLVGTIYDLQTTLAMVTAGVIIEVPLRNVQGSDVPLDPVTGHLSIAYVAPFLVTPTVQLTARESVAPGGNILIAASDRDHFEVQGVDAAGAPHGGGAIDYFVQGYGGHS